MKTWWSLAWMSTGWLVAAPVSAQVSPDDVTIRTVHLSGPVHMLIGRGGNIGVSIGEDGVLIVDDQFAPLADKIKRAIGKLGEGKIHFILNTHWHGDHTGGNPVFGRDGTIIAHSNVRKRLSTVQHLFDRTIQPLPKEGLPVITFDTSLSVHFNGEEIKALHLPHGHTDGDSVIFFTKSNVIHMGDDFFNGMYPFVDLDHGGDVEGLAENVGAVLDLAKPDAKIIPGHGPPATVDELKTFHAMLVDSIRVVREGIRKGKTLADIQRAGMPKRWEKWGNGFIKTPRWLETVYRSLTKEASQDK
ncbi:MAG: MBL fold metallo-hydrolase [Planctomycetota bacterium]|nr:MAG: MBL fold metallo-hydrolase [Planctomycetota bacterium]